MIHEKLRKILEKQRYKIVGNHSGAKLCLWTRKSIKSGGKEHCYKEKFYKDLGIKSHRCLQCSPAVTFCSLKCSFCWRMTELTTGFSIPKEDEPEFLVENFIEAQRNLLTGLGGVLHDEKYLKEANTPKNVAISLSGEPFCYSKLSELIKEFHKKDMITFLVTNGTFPERIEKLETLPTQLYVSLCSNSKEMFEKVQKPIMPDAWERLNQTLELLPQIKTRKVIRLTLVKDLNMKEPEKYAKLISKASADFVEIKSYMAIGFSRARLGYDKMPLFEDILDFSKKMEKLTGYKIEDYSKISRVVLLKRQD